jgi:hypothetical protein
VRKLVLAALAAAATLALVPQALGKPYVTVPVPAPGEVTFAYVTLKPARAGAKLPKVVLLNKASLPAGATVIAGVGRPKGARGKAVLTVVVANRGAAARRTPANALGTSALVRIAPRAGQPSWRPAGRWVVPRPFETMPAPPPCPPAFDTSAFATYGGGLSGVTAAQATVDLFLVSCDMPVPAVAGEAFGGENVAAALGGLLCGVQLFRFGPADFQYRGHCTRPVVGYLMVIRTPGIAVLGYVDPNGGCKKASVFAGDDSVDCTSPPRTPFTDLVGNIRGAPSIPDPLDVELRVYVVNGGSGAVEQQIFGFEPLPLAAP